MTLTRILVERVVGAVLIVVLALGGFYVFRLRIENGALHSEVAKLEERLQNSQALVTEKDAKLLAALKDGEALRRRIGDADVTITVLREANGRLLTRLAERPAPSPTKPTPTKPGPKPAPGTKPEPPPTAGDMPPVPKPLLPANTDVSAAVQIILVRLDDGSLARACRHPVYGDDVIELVRVKEGDPLLSRNPCVKSTEERLRLPAALAPKLWTYRIGIGASFDVRSLVRAPRVYAYLEAERAFTVGMLEAFCRGRAEYAILVQQGDSRQGETRITVECGAKF